MIINNAIRYLTTTVLVQWDSNPHVWTHWRFESCKTRIQNFLIRSILRNQSVFE